LDVVMSYRRRLEVGYYLMRHEKILWRKAASFACVDPDDLFWYLWRKHPVRATIMVAIAAAWAAADKLLSRR
jgi:hypothetical protein